MKAESHKDKEIRLRKEAMNYSINGYILLHEYAKTQKKNPMQAHEYKLQLYKELGYEHILNLVPTEHTLKEYKQFFHAVQQRVTL